jgi:hypothetical protein
MPPKPTKSTKKFVGHYYTRVLRTTSHTFWPKVFTKNVIGSVSFKKTPDSQIDTDTLVRETLHLLASGNRVRVSQAYKEVGHTYGVRETAAHIEVYDHSGRALYELTDELGMPKYWQYNYFLDKLSEAKEKPLKFMTPDKRKNADREYKRKCLSGDGACVHYFDTYIDGTVL